MKTRHPALKKVTVLLSITLFVLVGCGKKDMPADALELSTGSIIVGDLGWKEITTLSNSNSIRINGKAVGDVKLPVMGSRCTGFLIASNIVMTNHHCIPTSRHAEGVTVAFKHEKGIPESEWDKYDCSTFIGNDRTLDYALLKCEGNPGSIYGTVELTDSSVRTNDSLYIVQQNCDYYTKSDCDWSKKYSTGNVVTVDDEITHNADTLGGSSGSPVFSKTTHKVIGIHHAGQGNDGLGRGTENYAVPMSRIVPHIRANFPQVRFGQGGSGGGSDAVNSDGNDSFAKATKLKGTTVTKRDVHINQAGDLDYYKYTMATEGKLKIRIDFSQTVGDLELKVYNSFKILVAKSVGSGNSEAVEINAKKGIYYIKVFGYKKAKGGYTLSVYTTTVQAAKGNDTMKGATKLSSSGKVKGSISSSKDIDYFSFTVARRKTINASLVFTHSKGDLDLYLFDSSGKQLAKSDSAKNFEKISKALNAGKYYVLVKGYRSATGSYVLSVK